VQREIDKVAIKMLGLPWGNEVLNTLYRIIKSELDALQRILEESQRERRGKRVEEPEDDSDEVRPKQRSLVEWISRKED
jgi:hypothetical protein